MPQVNCPFCHQPVDALAFPAHRAEHTKLRPDGQQSDYMTLPPEARSTQSLQGVPRVYVHAKCGKRTGMPEDIIRSYLKNPFLYNANRTYCAGCKTHVPHDQCTWVETGQNMKQYMDDLRRAANAARETDGPTTGISALLRKLFCR